MNRPVSRAASRPRVHVLVDVASLAAFAWLCGMLARRLLQSTAPADLAWLLPIALGAGYLAADLCSGVVHWMADTWFREDTPLLGSVVIRAFREHHRDPGAIARRGLLETNGYNALVCLPVLAALCGRPAPEPGALAAVALEATVLATLLGVLATNQFHKWAHAERVPRGAAWLQRRGVILSARRHALHHREPDRGYCVTSGWWNGPLDALGVFPALERLIASLARSVGAVPRWLGRLLRVRPHAALTADAERARAAPRPVGLTREPGP